MRFNLLLLIFSLTLSLKSQPPINVILLPLKNNEVYLDTYIKKTIQNHQMPTDSLRKMIVNTANTSLRKQIQGVNFIQLSDLPEYAYLNDSLHVLEQWNTFSINTSNSQASSSAKTSYWGRVVNENYKSQLIQAMQKYNSNYILLLNRFETISPRPFNKKTYLSLHFEVYDSTFTKIIGNKSHYSNMLGKKTYIDVIKFYAQNSIREAYEQLKGVFR